MNALPGIGAIPGFMAVGEKDPFWQYVVFLSTLEGPNGGTNWVDLSPNAHPISIGAGLIETDTDLVGPLGGNGSSTLFPDTAGSRLEAPSHPDFHLAANDFTIEFLIYNRVFADNLYRGFFSVGGNAGIEVWRWRSGYNSGKFAIDLAGTRYTIDYAPNATLAWEHWAFERDGNIFRVYVNGVQVATVVIGTPVLAQGALTIGTLPPEGYSTQFSMAHARVTNGVCRYPSGANFIPPTLPFPAR